MDTATTAANIQSTKKALNEDSSIMVAFSIIAFILQLSFIFIIYVPIESLRFDFGILILLLVIYIFDEYILSVLQYHLVLTLGVLSLWFIVVLIEFHIDIDSVWRIVIALAFVGICFASEKYPSLFYILLIWVMLGDINLHGTAVTFRAEYQLKVGYYIMIVYLDFYGTEEEDRSLKSFIQLALPILQSQIIVSTIYFVFVAVWKTYNIIAFFRNKDFKPVTQSDPDAFIPDGHTIEHNPQPEVILHETIIHARSVSPDLEEAPPPERIETKTPSLPKAKAKPIVYLDPPYSNKVKTPKIRKQKSSKPKVVMEIENVENNNNYLAYSLSHFIN